MKRSLVRLFLALLPLGAWVDVACAQMTSVAAPSGTLQMGGISIASGTAVLMPVDAYGHPIPVTTSAGLSIPGSPARPVGYSCTITSGGMSACNVPDEFTASPSGFRYDITLSDSASGKAFTLRQVQGITGTSFRLDQYTPTVTVPVAAAMTRTDGSGAPSGACTAPAEYFDNTGHALYECVSGAWVSLTSSGGSGESVITGIRYGNGSSADTVANSSQVQTAIGSGVYDASGAAAAATASALQKTNNLSDLGNAATARTNLGLAHINENTPGVETVTQPVTAPFFNATTGIWNFPATTNASPSDGDVWNDLATNALKACLPVTGCFSVPTSSGTGTMVLLDSQTLGSAASSVTFTGISGSYKTLLLVVTARATGTTADGYVQFNSDSGANYSRQYLYAIGTAQAANHDTSISQAGLLSICGSDCIANAPAVATITIPSYSGSTFTKLYFAHQVEVVGADATSLIEQWTSGMWGATPAAITQMTIGVVGTTFVAGSTFSLYAY